MHMLRNLRLEYLDPEELRADITLFNKITKFGVSLPIPLPSGLPAKVAFESTKEKEETPAQAVARVAKSESDYAVVYVSDPTMVTFRSLKPVRLRKGRFHSISPSEANAGTLLLFFGQVDKVEGRYCLSNNVEIALRVA